MAIAELSSFERMPRNQGIFPVPKSDLAKLSAAAINLQNVAEKLAEHGLVVQFPRELLFEAIDVWQKKENPESQTDRQSHFEIDKEDPSQILKLIPEGKRKQKLLERIEEGFSEVCFKADVLSTIARFKDPDIQTQLWAKLKSEYVHAFLLNEKLRQGENAKKGWETRRAHKRSTAAHIGALVRKGILTQDDVNFDGTFIGFRLLGNTYLQNHPDLLEKLLNYKLSKKSKIRPTQERSLQEKYDLAASALRRINAKKPMDLYTVSNNPSQKEPEPVVVWQDPVVLEKPQEPRRFSSLKLKAVENVQKPQTQLNVVPEKQVQFSLIPQYKLDAARNLIAHEEKEAQLLGEKRKQREAEIVMERKRLQQKYALELAQREKKRQVELIRQQQLKALRDQRELSRVRMQLVKENIQQRLDKITYEAQKAKERIERITARRAEEAEEAKIRGTKVFATLERKRREYNARNAKNRLEKEIPLSPIKKSNVPNNFFDVKSFKADLVMAFNYSAPKGDKVKRFVNALNRIVDQRLIKSHLEEKKENSENNQVSAQEPVVEQAQNVNLPTELPIVQEAKIEATKFEKPGLLDGARWFIRELNTRARAQIAAEDEAERRALEEKVFGQTLDLTDVDRVAASLADTTELPIPDITADGRNGSSKQNLNDFPLSPSGRFRVVSNGNGSIDLEKVEEIFTASKKRAQTQAS